MTEPKKRSAKVAFTLETARTEILAKVAKGGDKGASSTITAKTKEPKRALYEQAYATLEAEGAISVDRAKDKPKYFSSEFAPSAAGAARKIEQLAATKHPMLLSAAELKKSLKKNEHSLLGQALVLLEADKRLLKLLRGKTAVYAHGDSLRALLGAGTPKTSPAPAIGEVSGETIRQAYDHLVRASGFPAVEIATLQRRSNVPMSILKDWLIEEHRKGHAIFSTSDWSLADEDTRAGLIEIEGRNERYLSVQLED